MNYKIERWQNAAAPNAAKLRILMESENYRVYQWSDAPPAVYPNHRHNEDQSHWIISGVLELTIKDVGVFVLKSGDRDFMPAGTVHSARVPGDEAVVYLIGEKLT